MGAVLGIVERLSKWMAFLSGVSLTFIMLLTVSDVVLRFFGHPIVGTFEIVGLFGAVVIGFSVPSTSWTRGHIFVDFFIQGWEEGPKNAINVITRLVSIVLFILIGWNLFIYAYELYKSGEVSLTRQIPFYPVAYGLGVCCFIECLVLICDIVKVFGGKYE